MKTLKSALCVKVVVEAGEEGTVHYSLLDGAMKFIEEHNFNLIGDPFGILLLRSHDEGKMRRYLKFFLPILN